KPCHRPEQPGQRVCQQPDKIDLRERASPDSRLLASRMTFPVGTADQFAANLLPVVRAIQSTGAVTLEAISCALNERGVRPARGTRWYASSVANLLSRAQKFANLPCA